MASDLTTKAAEIRAGLVAELRDDRHCNDWYLRQEAAALIEQQAAELAEKAGIYDEQVTRAEKQWQAWETRATTAESERDELLREKERLTRQLLALANALHGKHFANDAPNWQPLDDAEGLLSQIDNMTTGLSRAARPALENGPAGLAGAHSKSPAPSSQPERIAALEAVKKAIRDGAADELNGAPCGNIIVKGCEAAEYVHPEDAAEMFVECIADEVMAALAPLGEE